VFVRKVSVLPRPITPTLFSQRIQSIDNGTSAAMYHALQGAHMLDLHDMLVQDPRYWRGLAYFDFGSAELLLSARSFCFQEARDHDLPG
jgi:hypothetical protein